MSTEITTAFVKEYNAGVRLLQQQMGSRLRDRVMVDPDVEGDRSFYDQVDQTNMNEVTNRHGDTEYTDTPHRRRMVTLKTYEVADLVDRADRRRLLNDPINPYTRSMAAAANRRLDDIVITAFDATAKTGVDGSGSASFDTTNYQIAANFGGAAIGLTIAKLIDARRILEAAENEEGEGDDAWYFMTSAKGRSELMNQDPTSGASVVSADYNTIRALVNGQINTFLGFEFVKSQRGDVTAGDIRSDYGWVKRSMQLAISQEPRSFMDVLPTKRHSIQVRHEMDAGCTRMDEKGVVEVLCDQSP